MIKKVYVIFSLLLAFVLGGCQDFDSTLHNAYEDPIPDGRRTLIVYMAMNNSLSTYATSNVNAIKAGISEKTLAKGRVVVYKADLTNKPLLLEVKLDGAGKTVVDTLKRYGVQNSAETATLRAVIDDAKALAPGRSYSVVFGSHATGWQPSASGAGLRAMKGMPMIRQIADPMVAPGGRPLPLTRTVLDESVHSTYMSLNELAETLHDDEFDFILFDACHMGEVEVAYALRNKARWVMASPAEIIAEGMPYQKILGDLMAPEPRLADACRKYYNYYSFSVEPTATIGLYDCSKLDALATAMKEIVAAHRGNIGQMATSGLQCYDRLWIPVKMFDMADFVDKLMPGTSDPLKMKFLAALSDVVVYKVATRSILGIIPVNTYCGISSYVPTDAMGAWLNEQYMQTAWAQKVYGE